MKKGTSLIEIVVYIAILVVIILILTSSVLSMGYSYSKIRLNNDIERSALTLYSRLASDIQQAERINTSMGSFATTTGRIAVEWDSEDSVLLREFRLENGNIRLYENGIDKGVLTSSPNVKVTSFYIVNLQDGEGQAVTIRATLSGEDGKQSIEREYRSTYILKSSY